MPLSRYVSAEWSDPGIPGVEPSIRAMGDDDNIYFVPSVDTDVPPWPAFLETEEGQAFMKTPKPAPK